MIDFPCRCGHVFHVDQNLAGEPMQCPNCRKLVYVPTTSDLAEWETDGTYRMDAPPKPPEPGRVSELYRAFTHQSVDENGQPIDNRKSLLDPHAPPVDAEPASIPPRYDPETGELIRPLDIKPPAPPSLDPNAAVPVISAALPYASLAMTKESGAASPWRVLVELLMPINAVDMFFVLLFHVLFNAIVLGIIAIIGVGAAVGFTPGPSLWISVGLLLAWILMAHWMNTIEEIGPVERDELPRLFRSFSFGEDLWRPGWRGVFSLLICFGPAALVTMSKGDTSPGKAVALLLLAGGAVLFPAVAITFVAGDLGDLQPNRIFGMIGACGRSYIFLIFTFVLAAAVYALGLILSQFLPIVDMIPALQRLSGWRWRLGYPLLTAGIYLMHWFCWSAGLVYRQHREEFPWTWQRFFRNHASKTVDLVRAARNPNGAYARPTPARPARPPRPVSPLPIEDPPVRGFPVVPLAGEKPPPLPIPVQPIDSNAIDPPAGPPTPMR